jgi:2'-5' RNA ligase
MANLVAADLNTVMDTNGGFRSDGRVGWVGQGSCEYCNTTLSEAYPSVGGPDCSDACASGLVCGTTTYWLGDIHTPAGTTFQEQMLAAGEIMREFGAAQTQAGSELHMTLHYFCCHSTTDLATMKRVLEGVGRPLFNVTFGQAVVRIDSEPAHYSVIVMLDEESNARMMKWVESLEQSMREAGVAIHTPRSLQEPFHSTLGVVDGHTYPVERALTAVNTQIRDWTGGLPLTLKEFTINF